MISEKYTRLARLNFPGRLFLWLFSSQSDRDIARMQSESAKEVARYQINSWGEEQIANVERNRKIRAEKRDYYDNHSGQPGERWQEWMRGSTSPPVVPPAPDIAELPPTTSTRAKRTPQRTGNCNWCDEKLGGGKLKFCLDLHKSKWWNEENRRRGNV